LKLRDIAQAAELPAGQVHAYLVSFRKAGLIEQTDAGRYQLGPLALEIGLIRLRACDPLELIWTAMPACSEKLALAMTMTVWGEHGPTVLRVLEAPYQIYTRVRAGSYFGLLSTATGRVFAAFMPPELVAPFLKREAREAKRSGASTVDMDTYRASLARVRSEGCATTSGAPVPGIAAVSVPVFDVNDSLFVALTAIGPIDLVQDRPGGFHRETLLEFGKDLSRQLGAPPHRFRAPAFA
jgi:DNA-binding IclR family transcriptional regulator